MSDITGPLKARLDKLNIGAETARKVVDNHRAELWPGNVLLSKSDQLTAEVGRRRVSRRRPVGPPRRFEVTDEDVQSAKDVAAEELTR